MQREDESVYTSEGSEAKKSLPYLVMGKMIIIVRSSLQDKQEEHFLQSICCGDVAEFLYSLICKVIVQSLLAT